ncbi:MAG TPA: inosine/xanthosine triphosphatase [Thermomicrobiaceae bacterium]|nr:inosine/xanthosine triphosphatase [Thermomicrobiaceae bacterium]
MAGARARLALGSTNPAKRAAVERVAAALFPACQLATVDVPSGVPAQPWSDEETARGALARAEAARAALDADYGVGIESGVAEGPGGRLYAVSWAAAVDRAGRTGLGASERFALPPELAVRLRAGAELGPLLDELTGARGLSRRQGAVGILTQGRRDRAAILEPAVLHAFVALLEPWR